MAEKKERKSAEQIQNERLVSLIFSLESISKEINKIKDLKVYSVLGNVKGNIYEVCEALTSAKTVSELNITQLLAETRAKKELKRNENNIMKIAKEIKEKKGISFEEARKEASEILKKRKETE